VTRRLVVRWPDAQLFRGRQGRPYRILAVSDEEEPAFHSEPGRRNLGEIDLVVGCGDLEPPYLGFVTDAFGAPLVYVRGNHDVGSAWVHSERRNLPEPIPDGAVRAEAGLRIAGFSGSPRYNNRGMQVSALRMWIRVASAWPRLQRNVPLLMVSHAAPRGLNDADDHAHRGFTAFRWLVDRLAPPLWLHGHTALVRRGLDDRTVRYGPTILYNCTGATLVELVPADEEA
jgi:uncharacterized protein